MRKQPTISIITVNYNGLELTVELLNSIRRLTFSKAQLEIFVVDNASPKGVPSGFFADNFPEVHFIQSEKNLGFAGGNNLAVRQAMGNLLFFINNDAEITEGCLEKLVALFAENPKLGIASPMLLYFNESKGQQCDLIQYAGMTPINPLTARNKTIGEKTQDVRQFDHPQQTAYTHGAAMMVRREVIEKVGMLFEDFFLYYEELDWCERIRRAGFDIYIEPRAKVFHKESATVGTVSILKTYYLNRNRIYFMRRNFGGGQLLTFGLFFTVIAIPKNLAVFILRGQFDHAKVFLKAITWNIKDWFSKTYKTENPILEAIKI